MLGRLIEDNTTNKQLPSPPLSSSSTSCNIRSLCTRTSPLVVATTVFVLCLALTIVITSLTELSQAQALDASLQSRAEHMCELIRNSVVESVNSIAGVVAAMSTVSQWSERDRSIVLAASHAITDSIVLQSAALGQYIQHGERSAFDTEMSIWWGQSTPITIFNASTQTLSSSPVLPDYIPFRTFKDSNMSISHVARGFNFVSEKYRNETVHAARATNQVHFTPHLRRVTDGATVFHAVFPLFAENASHCVDLGIETPCDLTQASLYAQRNHSAFQGITTATFAFLPLMKAFLSSSWASSSSSSSSYSASVVPSESGTIVALALEEITSTGAGEYLLSLPEVKSTQSSVNGARVDSVAYISPLIATIPLGQAIGVGHVVYIAFTPIQDVSKTTTIDREEVLSWTAKGMDQQNSHDADADDDVVGFELLQSLIGASTRVQHPQGSSVLSQQQFSKYANLVNTFCFMAGGRVFAWHVIYDPTSVPFLSQIAIIALVCSIVGSIFFATVAGTISKAYMDGETQHANELQHQRDLLSVATDSHAVTMAYCTHQLRNPLHRIIASLSLMDETADELTEEHVHELRTISTCASELSRLITDITDLTTLNGGNMMVNVEEFDVRSMVGFAVKSLASAHLSHSRPVTVTFTIDSEVPIYARSDTMRLTQLLGVALTNAAQHGSRVAHIPSAHPIPRVLP